MKSGEEVRLRPGVGTIALDGEREIELSATSVVDVRLCTDGPFVVDVPAALEGAAQSGYLRRRRYEQTGDLKVSRDCTGSSCTNYLRSPYHPLFCKDLRVTAMHSSVMDF